jgi:hypothetical protein
LSIALKRTHLVHSSTKVQNQKIAVSRTWQHKRKELQKTSSRKINPHLRRKSQEKGKKRSLAPTGFLTPVRKPADKKISQAEHPDLTILFYNIYQNY